MTDKGRLEAICDVILDVENRCMAADGPVTSTLREMTEGEMREIWLLASGEETDPSDVDGLQHDWIWDDDDDDHVVSDLYCSVCSRYRDFTILEEEEPPCGGDR